MNPYLARRCVLTGVAWVLLVLSGDLTLDTVGLNRFPLSFIASAVYWATSMRVWRWSEIPETV